MKYTKSIIGLMTLNLILIFSTIFVANKSREVEKNNTSLEYEISKISENIKINEIEFTLHKNTTYLKKLYSLYFEKNSTNKITPIVSLRTLQNKDKSLNLIIIKD